MSDGMKTGKGQNGRKATPKTTKHSERMKYETESKMKKGRRARIE